MANYILSIDQGTTSSRAILFDTNANVHSVAQQEFTQYFPNEGWVEHDPTEIWQSVLDTCKEVIDQLTPLDHIIGVGITNQRETTLVWDRNTGEPLYNAIVWQDRRTTDYCNQLKRSHRDDFIRERTGLILDPYFSATKVSWILEHVEGAKTRALKGELAFGTVDSYLIWHLTAGKHHLTDATNASRTMLFNIHKNEWDNDLLDLFGISKLMLPQVKDCADDFGLTHPELFDREIPIYGVAGDQQAALIGQTCFEEGDTKSTYGTGCFMVTNTGSRALTSENRLLTTIGYRLNGETTYALEGSIFIAGAAVQWLRDGLKIIGHAHETQSLAEQANPCIDLVIVPAFTGLGAPYWDPDARGAIFGLTRDTGIKEIVAATLESVGFQSRDLQIAMEKDGQKPSILRVDGGFTHNNWAMQFLADILGTEIDRPSVIETTALGVAFLVGLQTKAFPSLESIKSTRKSDSVFHPKINDSTRETRYKKWVDAVKKIQTQR